MGKRLFCLLLASISAFAFTACAQIPAEDNPDAITEPTQTFSPAEESTEAPPVEPTVPSTEAPTEESTAPVTVQHSGLKPDGSFDSGTWFMGDSMTCILITDYLKPNNLIGEAVYTGKYGANMFAFFDDTVMSYTSYNKCVFRPEHEGLGYDDVAVLLGEQATAIYMMWGTNYFWTMDANSYIELVDFLLETCPNATIHMQLIPWGLENIVRYDLVNVWIQEAYAHYQEIGEDRVFLIDTYTAIGRNHDSGNIHLNYTGNENWYTAIVEHAKNNNLSQ